MKQSYYSTPVRSDELYHYGVLGMKWGQHRAAKRGGTYTYKSWGTKRNEFKAARVATKLSKPHGVRRTNKLERMQFKYNRRAKISRDLDKREQDYSKPGSALGVIGGRLAISALTNGSVAYKSKHHQLATAMISRNANKPVSELNSKDRLKSVIAGSAFAMTIGGRGAKTFYIRGGERKAVKENFGPRKERNEVFKAHKDYTKARRKENKSEKRLDRLSKRTANLDSNPRYSDKKRKKLADKQNRYTSQYMSDWSNRVKAQKTYNQKYLNLKLRGAR